MNTRLLRIDKEGRWFYQDEEITHRKTYLLFNRNLSRDGAGGYVLCIGREQCAVEVEDAPFVVKTIDFLPSIGQELKVIWLILNDETREPLDLETLRIGPDNVPYCRVRGGEFEARFSRSAYQLLAPLIQYDEARESYSITLDGKKQEL